MNDSTHLRAYAVYIINVPCLCDSMQALTLLIQAFFSPSLNGFPHQVVFNVSFWASSLLGGSVLYCSVVSSDHVHGLSSLLMQRVRAFDRIELFVSCYCQRDVCC